jgi:hypothetical protein
MNIREQIVETLTEIFEEEELEAPTFTDDLLLLDTGLDSLGFAVLVTRLEDELGYDPFALLDEPVYPAKFGELVEVYERFAHHART